MIGNKIRSFSGLRFDEVTASNMIDTALLKLINMSNNFLLQIDNKVS